MAVDYVTMLIYVLVMAGLGWWGMRKARTRDDFLLAGRRLGPVLYLGTLSAVMLGGLPPSARCAWATSTGYPVSGWSSCWGWASSYSAWCSRGR